MILAKDATVELIEILMQFIIKYINNTGLKKLISLIYYNYRNYLLIFNIEICNNNQQF